MNPEGQSVIDMLFELLGQLLIPNWSNLILLLPWVLRPAGRWSSSTSDSAPSSPSGR